MPLKVNRSFMLKIRQLLRLRHDNKVTKGQLFQNTRHIFAPTNQKIPFAVVAHVVAAVADEPGPSSCRYRRRRPGP